MMPMGIPLLGPDPSINIEKIDPDTVTSITIYSRTVTPQIDSKEMIFSNSKNCSIKDITQFTTLLNQAVKPEKNNKQVP